MSAPWDIVPFGVVDGGLSTALEARGHRVGGLLWTARFVVDAPDEIVHAHRSFVEAGADVVISASYQASAAGFERAGCDASAARAALASTTELARRSGAKFVAASIGPFGATLGDGSEYHGSYEASWADVRRFHRERLEVLADTGPDVFAIETIPSTAEATIIVEELSAVTDRPAWITFSCVDGERTCSGDDFGAAVSEVMGARCVSAVGVNCTRPDVVTSLLSLAASSGLPLVAYPNHGRTWDAVGECWVGLGDDEIADHVPEWVAAGARLIGGCCGVGASGVRAIARGRAALTSGA